MSKRKNEAEPADAPAPKMQKAKDGKAKVALAKKPKDDAVTQEAHKFIERDTRGTSPVRAGSTRSVSQRAAAAASQKATSELINPVKKPAAPAPAKKADGAKKPAVKKPAAKKPATKKGKPIGTFHFFSFCWVSVSDCFLLKAVGSRTLSKSPARGRSKSRSRSPAKSTSKSPAHSKSPARGRSTSRSRSPSSANKDKAADPGRKSNRLSPKPKKPAKPTESQVKSTLKRSRTQGETLSEGKKFLTKAAKKS